MNYKEISKGIIRAVLILLAFGIGLLLLNEIQILISYIIIAAVVSLIGRPFVRFFTEKFKFKNTTASILSMMILIGIIVGVISLFVPLVIEQGKNLSLLEVDSFKENILFLYAELSNYLSSYGFSLDNSIFNVNWLNNIDFTFLPEILNSIGKTLGNLTIGILSVMFISFFFLKDSKLILNSLLVLIPKKSNKKFKKSFDSISVLLSRYFAGLILQIFILFIIYTILLLIIGTPNAIVIAFFMLSTELNTFYWSIYWWNFNDTSNNV